jgi:hypothetical protein
MAGLDSCRLAVYNVETDSLIISGIIPTPYRLRWSPSGRYIAFSGFYMPPLGDSAAMWNIKTVLGFIDLWHDSATIIDTSKGAFLADWSAEHDQILLGHRNSTQGMMNLYEYDVKTKSQMVHGTLKANEIVGYGTHSSEVILLRDSPRGRDVWRYDLRTRKYQQITFDCPYMYNATIFRRP